TRVDAVRRFNRFYTQHIGVLHRHLLESPYSLTEARVIYELAHHETTTAKELAAELGLDPGYLSRILKGFEKRGLVARRRSETDGRAADISLTLEGQQAFAQLNARSRAEVRAMLEPLSGAEQAELVEALATVQRLLGGRLPRRVL